MMTAGGDAGMVWKAVQIFRSTREGGSDGNGTGAVTWKSNCLTGATGYLHLWGDVRHAVE